MPGDKAIAVSSLNKSYGSKEVFCDVSFTVASGTICAFLGNNGAGKTTTISILSGLLTPSSGEVRVLGEPMTMNNRSLKARMGTVFDAQNLFEDLTLAEHLTFSARLYDVPRAEIRSRAAELLSLLGLQDAAEQRLSLFSHGMKKKAALACALIHDPEVLFLDEPFEGVDAGSINTISQSLRALADNGRTIFVTSHILTLVERICTQVLILHNGTLVRNLAMSEMHGRRSVLDTTLESMFLDATETDRSERTLSWGR